MSPASGCSPLDEDTLNALVADLGRESATMIVRTFLQELGSRLAEISSGEPERIRRAAHPMKSGAALVGAHELSRVAALAEGGKDNSPEVGAAAKAAETALQEWLAG